MVPICQDERKRVQKIVMDGSMIKKFTRKNLVITFCKLQKLQSSASSSRARWAVLYACALLVLPHGQSCSWHGQIGPRSCGRPGIVPPSKPVMWVGGKCLVEKDDAFSSGVSIADMKFCVFKPHWRCNCKKHLVRQHDSSCL